MVPTTLAYNPDIVTNFMPGSSKSISDMTFSYSPDYEFIQRL